MYHFCNIYHKGDNVGYIIAHLDSIEIMLNHENTVYNNLPFGLILDTMRIFGYQVEEFSPKFVSMQKGDWFARWLDGRTERKNIESPALTFIENCGRLENMVNEYHRDGYRIYCIK